MKSVALTFVLLALAGISPASAGVIVFDFRPLAIEQIDGDSGLELTVDGLKATLTTSNGDFNRTGSGFGINATASGDDTDRVDGNEYIEITFDQAVDFNEFTVSDFGDRESLTVDFSNNGVTSILTGVGSPDTFSFSGASLSPTESVRITNLLGNGFSFDSFQVALASSNPAVPEPTSLAVFGTLALCLASGTRRRRRLSR